MPFKFHDNIIKSQEDLDERIKAFLKKAKTTHTFLRTWHITDTDSGAIISFEIRFDFYDEPYIQKYGEEDSLFGPGIINLNQKYYERITNLCKKYFYIDYLSNNTGSIISVDITTNFKVKEFNIYDKD